MSLLRLFLSSLIALALGSAAAMAQPSDAPASAASAPDRPSKGERQALKWFALLDANKDGRISREEAKVAFRLSPTVAEYFREADLNQDGYVTQQEIRTVAERRRAERQARRQREAEQQRQATALSRGEASTPVAR